MYFRLLKAYKLKNQTMKFQAIDWFGKDGEERYEIFVSGRTEDAKPVEIKITDFKPYFHILITSKNHSPIPQNIIDIIKNDVIRRGIDMAQVYKKPTLDNIVITKTNYKSLYGFNLSSTPQIALRCECDNHRFMKFIIYKCMSVAEEFRGLTLCVCDSTLEPFVEYMNSNDITPCSWLELPDNCRLDNVSNKMITVCKNNSIAPLVVASFDIECTSGDGSFPNPDKATDSIIMIASIFKHFTEDKPYLKHVVILGNVAPSTDDTVYEIVDNEKDLINKWIQVISKNKPDIITGYNTVSFDMKYIWERMLFLNKNDKSNKLIKHSLVRHPTECCKYESKKLESNALGNNDFNYIDIPGVNHIDMLYYIRKEYKLNSYKLDDVATEFMGDSKDPVTPQMIFDLFKGSLQERKVVVDYCIKDALLPLNLIDKLNVIPNLIQMANVTRVPLRYLMFRGQQIKVFSQISYYAHKKGFTIPKLKPETQFMGKYEGAIVLDAKAGAYKKPVTALDFASLYPNIIIAHNLCYTTYISHLLWNYLKNRCTLINNNVVIPGSDIVFNTYKLNDTDTIIKEFILNGSVYRFVQAPNLGLLPQILKELLSARKIAKKEMYKTMQF